MPKEKPTQGSDEQQRSEQEKKLTKQASQELAATTDTETEFWKNNYRELPAYVDHLDELFTDDEELENLIAYLLSEEQKDLLKSQLLYDDLVKWLTKQWRKYDDKDYFEQLGDPDSYAYTADAYRKSQLPDDYQKAKEYLLHYYLTQNKEDATMSMENLVLHMVTKLVFAKQIKELLLEAHDGTIHEKPVFDDVKVYPTTMPDNFRTGGELVIQTRPRNSSTDETTTFLLSLTAKLSDSRGVYATAMDDWQLSQIDPNQKRPRTTYVKDKKTGELIKKRPTRGRRSQQKTRFTVRDLGLTPEQMRVWTKDFLHGGDRFKSNLRNILYTKRIIPADAGSAKYAAKQEDIKQDMRNSTGTNG